MAQDENGTTTSEAADLEELRDVRAFDPAPSLDELYRYHVPFDDLVGRRTCEAPLTRAIASGAQVAIVGDSGSGKSSVIAHVLGPLVEGVAPLRIPVAIERPEVASDPARFASHLVRTVSRYVEYALPAEARRAQRYAGNASRMRTGTVRRRRFGGAFGWLASRLELASELEVLTEPEPRSSTEIVEQARGVLALIRGHDLEPVLIFDDTDKWFGSSGSGAEGAEGRDAVLEGFFGPVVRLIASDLGATAVLAVHTAYLDHPAYERAAGFVDTTVHVPRLPDPDALRRLLALRTDGREVLTPRAIDELFAYYNAGDASDLRRRVLLIAHTALAHACDTASDRIHARHIGEAIAEYGGSGAGRWRSLRLRRRSSDD